MLIGKLKSQWLLLIVWIGCGSFGISLASFMYSGWFSRYLADDYCKIAHFMTYGFWNGQVVAWHILAGRFMVTFLTGVFDLFGPIFYRLTPTLVLILWVAELSILLTLLMRFLPVKAPRVAAWLCGMVITLATIVGAESRLQSLYWRDGMFNYNFPILFFLLLMIVGSMYLEKRVTGRKLWFSVLGCALLAFMAAGCSESFAAYEIGCFIIAAGLFLLFSRGRPRGQALLMLGFAVAGALAGLALIWLSPDTPARQTLLPAPPGFITLVSHSMLYAYYFMRTSTNLMKLVTLMAVGIPAALTFFFSVRSISWKWWQWLLFLGLIPLVGYAALIPLFAPSVYAESSSPESRVLIIGRFSLVLTLSAMGGGIGLLARNILKTALNRYHKVLNVIALVILAVCCLYSLVISWQINSQEIPYRQAWAAEWDARDAQIRKAVSQGQTSIHVVELQSMGKLFEYGPDANDTLNLCVARYYGLQTIIATPP
jgi:Family of unknown function (DUF6056)